MGKIPRSVATRSAGRLLCGALDLCSDDVFLPAGRHREGKDAPLIFRKLRPRASANRFYRFTHNAETEAGARGIGDGFIVGAIELFEHLLPAIGGHAASGVCYSNYELPGGLRVGRLDCASDRHPFLLLV